MRAGYRHIRNAPLVHLARSERHQSSATRAVSSDLEERGEHVRVVLSLLQMRSEPHRRFSDSDVETWRREGVALIRDFFTTDEVAAVRADFETVFGRTAGAADAT